ncbi:ATP phosphoribosyltransferase [Coccomyxa sp. Obi]|nr:ATP phosphoribosyltransferase [Coccomyxa sp. Obi]
MPQTKVTPPPTKRTPRTAIRLAVPSKGRMAEDTLQLLKDCQLSVYKPNPRQYIASIQQMPGLEVWFQRASDVVRKLMYGDVDLGIVGYDMYAEIAHGDSGLIVLHDALGFGKCHLGLGIPTGGKWADINSLDDLRRMPEWTETNPLRVVTGYHNVARNFFAQQGFEHVVLLSADGALEAAPLMGTADIILDLVSTGVTLRENNLKEIEGGRIIDSQGVLVANKRALREQPGLLTVVHELIERLEAHLKADKFYSVVANMRGSSPQEVAHKILSSEALRGLQGPTISPVYSMGNGHNGSSTAAETGFYACVICVPKSRLYKSVKDLRAIGGSGVLVQPMTYIFDEEPERWQKVLAELDIDSADPLLATLDA